MTSQHTPGVATYALIHGAYDVGWYWHLVADRTSPASSSSADGSTSFAWWFECITAAIASQLVVTIDSLPDEARRIALADLWEEIMAYAETIPTLPLADVIAQLDEYKAEILEILGVAPQVTPSASSSSSPSASPEPSGSSSATPTPSPSASPSGSLGSSTPQPTPSTQGSPAVTRSPTPSPSSSATTSPTPTPTPTPSPTPSPG